MRRLTADFTSPRPLGGSPRSAMSSAPVRHISKRSAAVLKLRCWATATNVLMSSKRSQLRARPGAFLPGRNGNFESERGPGVPASAPYCARGACWRGGKGMQLLSKQGGPPVWPDRKEWGVSAPLRSHYIDGYWLILSFRESPRVWSFCIWKDGTGCHYRS
jgi:hypothetical protein